uniref:Uncharacterized protein n=1 Tax=Meloidogyne incognita TaxID=6306 RepID=A0A914M795_MELIC
MSLLEQIRCVFPPMFITQNIIHLDFISIYGKTIIICNHCWITLIEKHSLNFEWLPLSEQYHDEQNGQACLYASTNSKAPKSISKAGSSSSASVSAKNINSSSSDIESLSKEGIYLF